MGGIKLIWGSGSSRDACGVGIVFGKLRRQTNKQMQKVTIINTKNVVGLS
jgi:hypothetical protein